MGDVNERVRVSARGRDYKQGAGFRIDDTGDVARGGHVGDALLGFLVRDVARRTVGVAADRPPVVVGIGTHFEVIVVGDCEVAVADALWVREATDGDEVEFEAVNGDDSRPFRREIPASASTSKHCRKQVNFLRVLAVSLRVHARKIGAKT